MSSILNRIALSLAVFLASNIYAEFITRVPGTNRLYYDTDGQTILGFFEDSILRPLTLTSDGTLVTFGVPVGAALRSEVASLYCRDTGRPVQMGERLSFLMRELRTLGDAQQSLCVRDVATALNALPEGRRQEMVQHALQSAPTSAIRSALKGAFTQEPSRVNRQLASTSALPPPNLGIQDTSPERQNQATPNERTCVFSYYQSNSPPGQPDWFRRYATFRQGAVGTEQSGVVPAEPVAWNTDGALPTDHLRSPRGGECTKIYFIYSGHGLGDGGEPYATFVRAVRAKFPNYTTLVVEDTSCQGMSDPTKAVEALNAEGLRPRAGQTHRFWGNQLHTGPVHTQDDSNTYYSWYGVTLTGNGGTEHNLWPCHTRNPCSESLADGVASHQGFWCLDSSNRPIYNRCVRTRSGGYQWTSDMAFVQSSDQTPFPHVRRESGRPH